MVCSHNPSTGIYEDENGWLLQACSNPWCTVGYTYLFSYEVMVTLHRAFGRDSMRNAVSSFMKGPEGRRKYDAAITQYQ